MLQKSGKERLIRKVTYTGAASIIDLTDSLEIICKSTEGDIIIFDLVYFPVCWFGGDYKPDRLPRDSHRQQEGLDILSRLEVKVYTRHLVRLVLSFMTEAELSVMTRVSTQWRRLLRRELRPTLFSRIRNLQIVETENITW